MGSITTGVGLISGIDIASLIDSIITLESQSKFRLQERIATLQSQQTALLDINARLLNLKSAAGSFRLDNVFESALATSSDPEAVAATASIGAQPGTFTFIVKQLVSSSQVLSQGYATRDATPLGLDSISFEFGKGRLDQDLSLEELNGGTGVDRGRIQITDRTGATATIDLTDVTAMSEVLERINEDEGIQITASVQDDHLVLTDTSGGAGSIAVAETAGSTTAADLGIVGNVAGPVLTGTSVHFIGANSALSTLNDSNGVLTRNNVDDLDITARDGTVIGIDLGRIDLDIDDTTLLADLNNGTGVTIDDDSDEPDIQFVARDGTEHDVDLTGVTTIGQLRTRVSAETSGHITISVTDGDKLTVTDTIGGGGNLQIKGAGPNTTETADDLGILNEAGVAADSYTGAIIPNQIADPAVTTIQGVIDRINNDADNGGKVVASIAPDGLSLQLEDFTGSFVSNLTVASTVTNPHAASDLGLEKSVASNVLGGDRVLGGLGSVLTRNINGGAGLPAGTQITIDDREGDSVTILNLESFGTLDLLIEEINTQAAAANVDVTVGLNETGNGLLVNDTSGGIGNLVIGDPGATALGIAADVADDSVRGANLQLRYVSHATRLEDLNHGRGVGTGSFRITDGLGNTGTVSIGGSEETVYDVIQEINSKGLAINARINDNGDGIVIEEGDLGGETPFVKIKVETVGGTAASDLNIDGEAADLEGGFIDGSYEETVDLETSDSLDTIVTKINDAGIPVSAAVLNTGAGAQPFRLSLSSEITGRAGDLIIDTDGVELGLNTLSRGEDAKVFFGASNPEDAFLLTSSSNTLDGVIPGLSLDLLQAGDEPVTVTVSEDKASIVEAVKRMVTTFNDVVGRIDEYDFFDIETEQRGPLLGDPTVDRIRNAMYRVATGSALNVEGPFQFLSQVGIAFNSEGEMSFDEDAFAAAYAVDPDGVAALFEAYDATTGGSEEIGDGITIDRTTTTYNSLGFGSLFENLADALTNSLDGTVTRADESFTTRIDLLNDRIDTLDDRLERRRAQLLREFTAMETALAQLQGQSSSIGGLASNVSLAGSVFQSR